jgi:hypothetical protein
MNRNVQLRRSGFTRNPGKVYATLSRATPLERKTPLRSRKRKPTVAEGSKFIDACRGETCYLRVPGMCCSIGFAHYSVVDCHSNQSKHGKAGGLKAKHEFTVPGCGNCHAYIDQGPAPRDEKFAIWDRAYAEWEPVRSRKMGLPEVMHG